MDGCFSRYRNNAWSYYKWSISWIGKFCSYIYWSTLYFLKCRLWLHIYARKPSNKKRSVDLSFSHVRPFHQLQQLFKISSVIPLLTVGFAVWLAAGSLQSIFSQFSIDTFQWKAGLVGLSFSLIGILDIVSQLFIMPRLLKKIFRTADHKNRNVQWNPRLSIHHIIWNSSTAGFVFIWDYLLWFRRFYFYSCIQWPTIQFCFRKPARSCNGRYPKYTISIARHRPANRRTALCRSTSSSDGIRIFAYNLCLLLLQYKTLVSFASSYKFSVSTDKTKYCVKFFFWHIFKCSSISLDPFLM